MRDHLTRAILGCQKGRADIDFDASIECSLAQFQKRRPVDVKASENEDVKLRESAPFNPVRCFVDQSDAIAT
jgi:hypothetical protein